MYRIRFHGRGGQGMKTASRILGTAFFLQGYEVQDAPRYGAERRGAPIFAYVRASKSTIYERGVIDNPDLVIIADESLVAVSAAEILSGVDDSAVILINSETGGDVWKNRLNIRADVFSLPAEIAQQTDLKFIGAECAGASARLTGVISWKSLEASIHAEIGKIDPASVDENLKRAALAYDLMKEHEGCVRERSEILFSDYKKPDWIDIPLEFARVSAPDIHAAANSVEVKTGLWRTFRPVIDRDVCRKCWWICSTFCPDGAISVHELSPQIDYDHCKGCLICVAQCPPHAIGAVPESVFLEKSFERGDKK